MTRAFVLTVRGWLLDDRGGEESPIGCVLLLLTVERRGYEATRRPTRDSGSYWLAYWP
jgi:hypothetical protein